MIKCIKRGTYMVFLFPEICGHAWTSHDEIRALFAITIPIVSNGQTDGNSRLPNSAYCADRKGTCYDFETDPEAGHDFEIFNRGFPSTAPQSVS